MKKIIVPFLSLMGLLFFVSPSFAASSWYLDQTNGTDTSGCGTSVAPCKTIQFVMSNYFNGGDTLYIMGNYTLSTAIDLPMGKAGSSDSYSTISSWPASSQSIIDGNYNPGGYIFNIAGADNKYWKISNLGLTNTTQTAIYVQNNASKLIFNNLKIYNNRGSAFNLSTATDVIIKNSLIYNNNSKSGSATIGDTNGVDIRIYNNSFYNNKKVTNANNVAAIATENGRLAIINNIISNSEFGVWINNIPCLTSASNNIYYSLSLATARINTNNILTLTEWQSLSGLDANSLAVDPLFVSTTTDAENLHLQTTSPAIDTGLDLFTASVATDLDGEIRPYGAAFDIGADELPIPSAPTAPIISGQTTTTANLAWTASPTATTSYTLEYGTDSTYTTVTSVTGLTTTAYAFTGLTANTTYYYRVKAIYTGITDYTSAYATGSFVTAPDAPVNIVATTRKAKTITLTWDVPVGIITNYSIAYATNENFSSNMLTATTTTNTVDITGLTANTTYYFSVIASNSTLNSVASSILATRTKPAKIQKVTIPTKYLTSTAAKVKWHKPAHKSGLKYQVKLMNKHGKKIKTYKLTTKLFKNLENLTSGKVYKIKVRAKYDKDNYGAWSKIKKFTTIIE